MQSNVAAATRGLQLAEAAHVRERAGPSADNQSERVASGVAVPHRRDDAVFQRVIDRAHHDYRLLGVGKCAGCGRPADHLPAAMCLTEDDVAVASRESVGWHVDWLEGLHGRREREN